MPLINSQPVSFVHIKMSMIENKIKPEEFKNLSSKLEENTIQAKSTSEQNRSSNEQVTTRNLVLI